MVAFHGGTGLWTWEGEDTGMVWEHAVPSGCHSRIVPLLQSWGSSISRFTPRALPLFLSPPAGPIHPAASPPITELLGACASLGALTRARSLGKDCGARLKSGDAVPRQLSHGNHCQGDRALPVLHRAAPSGNFI